MKRLLSALFLLGCAETPPIIEGPSPSELPPAPPSARLDAARPPPGKLYRDDVERAVDAGLGQFLQKVSVEAQLRDGKFNGWIVRGLYPPDFWAGIDLRPGDVVTSVNGKPIERDTDAYSAFQSLKTAPRLDIAASRDGAPHPLGFEIVPRPTRPN